MASHESYPYGVGVSKEGKHPRVLGYPAYKTWQLVLGRCYSDRDIRQNKAYKDCFVCSEWLEYQVFADWYIKQKGHNLGWQIDKDLLASRLDLGKSLYSPETCILLPEEINKSISVSKPKPSGLPVGVTYNNSRTKYVARYMNEDGINTHIGTYLSPEEAFEAYKGKKQEVLTYLANQYKDYLDEKAYTILTNYFI